MGSYPVWGFVFHQLVLLDLGVRGGLQGSVFRASVGGGVGSSWSFVGFDVFYVGACGALSYDVYFFRVYWSQLGQGGTGAQFAFSMFRGVFQLRSFGFVSYFRRGVYWCALLYRWPFGADVVLYLVSYYVRDVYCFYVRINVPPFMLYVALLEFHGELSTLVSLWTESFAGSASFSLLV